MSDDVTGSTHGVSGEEGYAGTAVGRRTILNLVGIVTANVARLVALAMVGHAGGPSTLGNIQSVVSAANLAALAGPSSMGAAAGRYLPVAQDANGTAKRLLWQGSTLGVVLAIICAAALLPFFGPEVALATGLFTVVMCVWLVARGVMIGRGSALGSMLWVEVGAALALVVAMAALVWWGAPWPSYVLALMLLNLPLAVWVWAEYRSHSRASSVGPGYRRYVGFAVVGTIASAGLVHLTNLVTNGLGGTVQAGYLAAGLLLLSPLGMALAALAQVSLPWLSRLVSEDRDGEARRRVHQLTASTQFTMGTVLLALIPCGPWLGRVAFGADMHLDYPLLIVLGCATLALGTRMGSGVFLSARGFRDVQRMAGLSYVGLAVAMVVWAVTYAAVGRVPAVSASLGYALGSAAVTVLIIRVALGVRASVRVALGLALWSGVAWCVTYAVAHPSWLPLVGAVAAVTVWATANRAGIGHLSTSSHQWKHL